MIQEIKETLENKGFDYFLTILPEIITKLTEKEKQELLTEIIDYHYDIRQYSKFKKAFDIIIGSKLNLNFNIDHWAPTFLSLIVSQAPSTQLLDYFVQKGADINFVGDTLAFEEGESLEYEAKRIGNKRYQTCLDFAQLKVNDLLARDYNYGIPDKLMEENDENEYITIRKETYLNLYQQAAYLYDLVCTDKVLDHIRSLGGKKYDEIKRDKNELKSRIKKG